MRPMGRLALLPALVLALPACAEEADSLLGEWAQIASNAGACPRCRIVLQAGKPGLVVTANNGWAATVRQAGAADLVGSGRWDADGRSWASGCPFTIRFHRDGDRLHMTMEVETGAARRPVVQAIFSRPWQGV